MTESRTVLIVDDDADIRDVLGELLVAAGFDVVAAANGKAALELIDSATDTCVVLLDLRMPVMDGWQFIAEAHDRFPRERFPIIVMTAGPGGERARSDLDVFGFVRKPFDPAALISLVSRAFG